jgi:hypothetical protein
VRSELYQHAASLYYISPLGDGELAKSKSWIKALGHECGLSKVDAETQL